MYALRFTIDELYTAYIGGNTHRGAKRVSDDK